MRNASESTLGLRHPRFQEGWVDAPHQQLFLGDFKLESGRYIEECCLSYVIHGTLNDAKDNAVLALSAIGTSHHRLDFLIGPGKALDTDRFAVICVDALGNGLSSSPSNSQRQPYKNFPRFTIRDMVESQRRLLQDVLGIGLIHAVIGASMGGMQALQWAVSHPTAMRGLVAMTPMARTTAWSAAVNAASRGALMADPRWAEPGWHSRGQAGYVALMHLIAGRTPQAVNEEFSGPEQVLAWLEDRLAWQREQQSAPIDWIWQSFAYDGHDVGQTPAFSGDTDQALRSIKASTLILTPPLDLYNPTEAAQAVEKAISGAVFKEIPSFFGHQAAGPGRPADAAWLNGTVGRFLLDLL